jgi:hypothetical protein
MKMKERKRNLVFETRRSNSTNRLHALVKLTLRVHYERFLIMIFQLIIPSRATNLPLFNNGE